MADITAFPTIQNVLYAGSNLFSMKAGETIKAGQVVGIAAAGASMTAVVMDATVYEHSVGVALAGASSGDYFTVCGPGCICTVANADDTTGIDAGSYVTQNDNAVKGTVSAISENASGTTATKNELVGQALDDIAGEGTGKILVMHGTYTVPNAS